MAATATEAGADGLAKSETSSESRTTREKERRRDNANAVHPVATISYSPHAYYPQAAQSREPTPEEKEEEENERFNRERRLRRLRSLQDAEIKSDEMDVEEENLKKSISVRVLRKELKELEGQDAKGGRRGAAGEAGSAEDDIPLALIEKLNDFPEEKREAFLQTYTMVKMAQKNATGSGDMGSLAPFLLMFSQNHNAPDIGKYGENLIEALKTGVAMASPGDGGGESLSDKLAMKAFDMLTAGNATPAKSGMAETLETIKGLKEAGLTMAPADVSRMIAEASKSNAVPMPAPGTTATEVELKRLETDQQIRMAEISSNEKVEMAKLVTERERTGRPHGGRRPPLHHRW